MMTPALSEFILAEFIPAGQKARIYSVQFSLKYGHSAIVMLEKFTEIHFSSSSTENSSFTVKSNIKISEQIADSLGWVGHRFLCWAVVTLVEPAGKFSMLHPCMSHLFPGTK